MDDGGEALIGLVGAHGDAFEFLEIAEEVLDQVIANPTIADAILDRLVHNAQRLTLKGDSIAKDRSQTIRS